MRGRQGIAHVRSEGCRAAQATLSTETSTPPGLLHRSRRSRTPPAKQLSYPANAGCIWRDSRPPTASARQPNGPRQAPERAGSIVAIKWPPLPRARQKHLPGAGVKHVLVRDAEDYVALYAMRSSGRTARQFQTLLRTLTHRWGVKLGKLGDRWLLLLSPEDFQAAVKRRTGSNRERRGARERRRRSTMPQVRGGGTTHRDVPERRL